MILFFKISSMLLNMNIVLYCTLNRLNMKIEGTNVKSKESDRTYKGSDVYYF